MSDPRRKTKIVATIGPACSAEKPLRNVIEAGVDVCRLNFSHGTHDQHSGVLERIRRIEQEIGRPIAVLQDLCGPKIRVTQLPNGAIELVEGQTVTVVAGLEESTEKNVIGASLDNLCNHAEVGHRILMDDGLLELRVMGVDRDAKTLTCEVIYGGTLKKRKGINLPDTKLDVPSVTDKDKRDLEWGLKNGVEYVALSFVRSPEDVDYLREQTKAMGTSAPRVIAKIEKPEAVINLESIVKAFDGVMVARGDLSVEIPLWSVPAVQKEIIAMANKHDRLVITATQMLDSMQERPRPTRAEVSDVANAIYDGTDAVMLSGETASGKYPEESVRVMSRIALAADTHADRQYGSKRYHSEVALDTFSDPLCGAALSLADDLDPCCVVTFTSTGKTALYMTKYHPAVPIMGAATERDTLRRMCLYRGVVPIEVEDQEHSEPLLDQVEVEIVKRGLGKVGDAVVYVGGSNLATEGNINSLKVRRIEESARA